MDTPFTFNVDARRGRIIHIGRDQLNLSLYFPHVNHPSPAPLMMPLSPAPFVPPSTIFSYPRKFLYGVCSYLFPTVFHRCNSLDLSDSVVLQGTHYIAIGEHADLWEGRMSDKKVAVKVPRSGSSSTPTSFLQKSKERLVNDAPLISAFYGNTTVVEYVKEKDDEIRLDMVKQIARGLDYLHGKSVVHGDLRGANVIVDGNGYPRICDYGLVFIIEPSEFTSIKTGRACRWTAPEIMDPPEDLMSANHSLHLFTKEGDVYAFAMTVLEIFTGNLPFYQKKYDGAVIHSILGGGRPEIPRFLDERKDLRQLVRDCWHQEASRRPTSRAVTKRLNMSMPEDSALGGGNQPPGWFESWF